MSCHGTDSYTKTICLYVLRAQSLPQTFYVVCRVLKTRITNLSETYVGSDDLNIKLIAYWAGMMRLEPLVEAVALSVDRDVQNGAEVYPPPNRLSNA